jgi:hypothetical protein
MLVLLKEVIYEVQRSYVLRRHDTCSKFYDDLFGYSGNIKVITSTIWEVVVFGLLIIGIS